MLSNEQLLKLLKDNGWEVASNDFFDSYNRIILKKGEISFPLQFKPKYAFTSVVRLCKSLEIEPPADHLRCYDQYEEYKKMQALQEKENPKGKSSK
jgi:hypothetical protein